MVTQAELAYRRLEPITLGSHREFLERRLAKIGAPVPRYPSMFDSPLHEALGEVTADVLAALVDLGFAPGRVAALTVGLTGNDGFTARYRSFPGDGSGLVLVSDSMVSLCYSYCEFEGRALQAMVSGGLLRMAAKVFLTRFTGTIGGDPRSLAGILRYHNVNRRVYGVPAVLNLVPVPDDPGMDEFLLDYGLRFVVGHEAAHHVLDDGHSELDADTLALFTAAEAFARYQAENMDFLPERYRREAAEFHGLIGALITMLALQTSERALFLRRGHSHLPAQDRATRLVEHVLSPARQETLDRLLGGRDPRMALRFDKDRGNLGVYVGALVRATAQASDFSAGATPFDWAALAGVPEIEQLAGADLDEIAALDRLMCGPDPVLTDRLDPGTRHILAGRLKEGLSAWGLAADRVEALLDPSRVLAFHTLVEDLQNTAKDLHTAVAAATLVARRLPGTESSSPGAGVPMGGRGR
ncbi:hypothetical protein [Actinoplanes friuliensis]|uniref:hypothetical protein n=1 Tax=Actinoplanes friuliensis TaxID=196914 RepID=UPI00041900C3|nr:hypothetical protein [Actinoplanes friuliensis]